MNNQNNQVAFVNPARVIRTVIVFWLAGWFIKGYFFFPYLFGEVIHYPIINTFFPEFFRQPIVLQFFYLLPLVAIFVMFRRESFYYWLAVVSMLISSSMLLLHQDTHNDATFVTSFWVALWLMWFVSQKHRRDDGLMIHARSLALCIVGFIFLGGFVGKLTLDYWDGVVLSNIFLSQEPTLINTWVRSNLNQGDIRWIFAWISKLVIFIEGLLVFAPLWPYRYVFFLGIGLMLSISLFTTWRIFSVLFCLIGLLIAVRPAVSIKKSFKSVKKTVY